MFAGKQPNPYDEIVAKTTDENLTSENWELILNLCDKVSDEGEQGARNVIASLLKRLAHRNPNVQLYALALGEALSKNCGTELHSEMASRSFTQGLEKLVTDRMTHEKVKRRALYLVSLWTGEFENNPQLGLMEELYNTLKAKNFRFDQVSEPPPPNVDDEVRRKEEEELQRVLEMSLHDKGGRDLAAWGSSNGNVGSSTSKVASSSSSNLPGPSSSGGYTPIEPPRSAYPVSETHHQATSSSSTQRQTSPTPAVQETPRRSSIIAPERSSSLQVQPSAVTRVRALHTFEPTVAGELAFEKGDIIKVTDRAYDNWWRGQIRGRTGIFPVNYVEPLPDLTPEDIAREAEQEAAVFAQAANIDKLINMLRGMDPAKDNLADNEEIQELYRSSMALRPKIVKLIDKYSQKRAELVTMNENFVKARGVFEQMMEDSLARHTGVYDNARPTFRGSRSDSRNVSDYRASTYGWDSATHGQPSYNNAYSAPPAAYGEQPHPPHTPYQQPQYGPHADPHADPHAYSGHHQPSTYPVQLSQQGPQPYPPVESYASPPPSVTGGPGQTPGAQHQLYGQGSAPTDPAAYAQQNPQAHGAQAVPQAQGQAPSQAHPQGHPQSQQPQGQFEGQQQQQQQGPPYVYDPNTQYADPNVQAWAQYYAQGGTDPSGAVYFISIPGVTDAPTQPSTQPTSGYSATPSHSPTTAAHLTSQPQSQPQPAVQSGSPVAATTTYPVSAQGPSSSSYQPYGPAPPASSSPDHQTQHPQLHVQTGYQPPSGTAPQPDAGGVSSAAPYGAPYGAPPGQSQAYAPGGYPGAIPSQNEYHSVSSPIHDGPPNYQQQPRGQISPTVGATQS